MDLLYFTTADTGYCIDHGVSSSGKTLCCTLKVSQRQNMLSKSAHYRDVSWNHVSITFKIILFPDILLYFYYIYILEQHKKYRFKVNATQFDIQDQIAIYKYDRRPCTHCMIFVHAHQGFVGHELYCPHMTFTIIFFMNSTNHLNTTKVIHTCLVERKYFKSIVQWNLSWSQTSCLQTTWHIQRTSNASRLLDQVLI